MKPGVAVNELVRAVVEQIREMEHVEHNRIIAAIEKSNEKMLKSVLAMERTNGQTIERILGIVSGLEDKMTAIDNRMEEFERRLAQVESRVRGKA